MTTRTLLTTAEVAERLGYNIKTVQRKAAAGQIPGAEKLPGLRGAFVFDVEKFEAYMRATPYREINAERRRQRRHHRAKSA